MLLNWSPLVRLSSSAYEAWVAPRAGGRLCRLVWHGPKGDRDLVEPVQASGTFDADTWPKQGAFPMLPYTNRLANARFDWRGEERILRSVPGQVHGLHGVGHRRSWEVVDSGADHVSMCWHHQADAPEANREWPWSFTAEMNYRVDDCGLHFSLALRNDSDTAAPAILGWHPYVPSYWLTAEKASGMGTALHDLVDGLHFPTPPSNAPASEPIAIDLHTPHTLAVDGWASTWLLQPPSGEQWRLDSDARHLVHHVPPPLSYACVEPVTSMPGSLHLPNAAVRTALGPGHWRRLSCQLQAAGPTIAAALR